LAPLIERKRHLRLPVLRLVLPAPAHLQNPGERLGIDFSRMRSGPEIAAAIDKVVAAVGRGEIAPAEALRLVRRSRKPLRAMRRQLWRKLAYMEATRRAFPSAPPPCRGHSSGMVRSIVVPAKAGTHFSAVRAADKGIPAFAGMTGKRERTYKWRGSRSAGFSTRPTPLRRSAPAGTISSAPTPGPALSAGRS
jgi:hypothetical protein